MKQLHRATLAILLSVGLTGSAWADRYYHHQPRTTIHWGINLGSPWPYSPFYSPFHQPLFAAPPLILMAPPVQPPPPVYIEQQTARQTLEPGYWYYCQELQAYYPYVRECPGAWQPIAPQPPR
jgi:hypothetical protein